MKIKVEYGNAWDRLSGDDKTILFENLSRRLDDLEMSDDEEDAIQAKELEEAVNKLYYFQGTYGVPKA